MAKIQPIEISERQKKVEARALIVAGSIGLSVD
jgi:hypothetical protein